MPISSIIQFIYCKFQQYIMVNIVKITKLKLSYDLTEKSITQDDSLCNSCSIKGKSFLCLINKKLNYPFIKKCNEYKPK